MPIWFLLGLGKLKSAFVALFGAVARYPWQAACIALLCVSAWLYHGKHKVEGQLHDCQTARKADQAQWNKQVAAAKAATALAQKQGKEASSDAETYHTALVKADSGLRDYIAANRLRPGPRSPAPASAGRGDDPAVHADAPAVPTVAVPDSVLKTCDDDYTYASGAYKLGQDLIAKGLATTH